MSMFCLISALFYDMESHLKFLEEAIKEAKAGLDEGGIPIGSVLVFNGKIIGRGRNMRVQKNSAILHGEMSALVLICQPNRKFKERFLN